MSRRSVASMGVLLGALAASALAWTVIASPPDEPASREARVAGANDDVGVKQEGADAGLSGRRPIETYEVFAPKDPFEPLVAGGGGTPAAVATVEGGITTDFQNGSSEPGFHHQVKVLQVDRRSALIAVDSVQMEVREGEIFAERFQLLSVADDCVSMLFGDDQFTLCEGEEIFK